MGKKFSLHIGLNTVDPFSYTGKYPPLRNAENDTIFFAAVAAQKNFDATSLIGKDATADNLLKGIRRIAAQMNDGDLFFLSYSGHGTRVRDLNGDEQSNFDQVMVLYDRLFIDDELQPCWLLFPEATHIFFVNDSCYNGTVSRFFLENRDMLRSLSMDHIFRGVEVASSSPDFQKHEAFYASLPVLPPAPCPIIHIAACTDNQLADDGTPPMSNGLFTIKFKDIYADGNFGGSYRDFYDALLAVMPFRQTPVWDVTAGGDTGNFEAKKLLE